MTSKSWLNQQFLRFESSQCSNLCFLFFDGKIEGFLGVCGAGGCLGFFTCFEYPVLLAQSLDLLSGEKDLGIGWETD